MIQNYAEKKKKKLVELDFSANGGIAVLERTYNPLGVRELSQSAVTSVQHIDDRIADLQTQAQPILDQIADLEAMRPDVVAKEKERADVEKAQAKA